MCVRFSLFWQTANNFNSKKNAKLQYYNGLFVALHTYEALFYLLNIPLFFHNGRTDLKFEGVMYPSKSKCYHLFMYLGRLS